VAGAKGGTRALTFARPLRIGVVMYQTSLTKGQELVAQRMVREFNRLGHSAYLVTSRYHDWRPVLGEEETTRHGGFVHLFDDSLGIPVIRVGSEIAGWPPRRILFRDFVGVLTRIVSDLKLNVLITHSTLWNGPEDAMKFVVWNRKMTSEGANNPPILLYHMSHFQEATDDRYTVEERTFRETWNRVSLGEILREADRILVTTPVEQMQMKVLGVSDDKCLLYPGGIDERLFDEPHDGGRIRRKLGLPASSKLVTFLGTIEERKNVLRIVEVARAFEESVDVNFVIAGRLDGDYANRVRAAVAGMKGIVLAGEITDEEKAQLIDESFVNLTMSRSEALGIAQLEFMHRGVPVISSGVGGQSWLVQDGVNGVLLKGPDDVNGAIRVIRSLSVNSQVRKKLSRGAIQTSAQATLSHLVAGLAEDLSKKLGQEPETTRLLPGSENLVEAKVQGKRRVTVTTQRLIVSSAEGGKLIVSIPFGQIVRISRWVRRPWIILILGLSISAAGFVLEMRFPLDASAVIGAVEALAPIAKSALGTMLFRICLPLIPAVAAAATFYHKIRDGFVVQYGHAKRIFLAREFGMALRTVHALVSGIQGSIDEPDRV
jgi:glycosyltransferase involved in cell wall biosynthesis